MSKREHLNIAIVGGSLSGLFAALAVSSLGHSVHVLERYTSDSLIDQGAGLRIGPDVYAFLLQYIPKHEVDSGMVVCGGLRILDRAGSVAHEVKIEVRVTRWGSLHGICLKQLEKMGDAKYEDGCVVESIEEVGKQLTVGYVKNGTKQEITSDLIIGADGPSSRVRQCFLPDVQRTYTGYGTWRGLVPETELSAAAKAEFVDRSSWYWGDDFMVLGYPIPGPDGSIEVGKRLVNWVWYHNWPEEDLDVVMTDVDGVRHNITVSRGKMRPDVAERQKKLAQQVMPRQYAEIIGNTEQPFVQLVTDMLSTQNSFAAGKVVLVGDAMAGPRPHVAASTSQAVFHVSELKKVLEGGVTMEEWSQTAWKMSHLLYEAAVELGPVCQSTTVKAEDKFGVFSQRQMILYKAIAALSTA